MQILTNGEWADLPIELDMNGSSSEINEKMIAQGYNQVGVEIGASEHSMNSLRTWTARSDKANPRYVLEVCLGGVIMELGASTFSDYIRLLQDMTAMVHNALVADLVEELVFGEIDIIDLLGKTRRHLNG